MGEKKALTHWGREGRPFWKVRVFDVPGENKEIATFPGGIRFAFRRGRDTIIPDAVLEVMKQSVTPVGDFYGEEGWYLPVMSVNNNNTAEGQYRETINKYPMTTPIQVSEEEFVEQMRRLKKRVKSAPEGMDPNYAE